MSKAAVVPLGATVGGAKPVNAEMWLIHRMPSGSEQTFHQVVRLPREGGTFGFAPTTFGVAGGDVNVELNGSIERVQTPAGTELMVVRLTRIVRGAGLPPEGSTGTTSTVVPMPDANDVLELSMPGTAGGRGGARRGGGAAGPPGTGGGGAVGGRGSAGVSPAQVAAILEGHQFSIRLRVTPGGLLTFNF
jgi:hypothetical protein